MTARGRHLLALLFALEAASAVALVVAALRDIVLSETPTRLASFSYVAMSPHVDTPRALLYMAPLIVLSVYLAVVAAWTGVASRSPGRFTRVALVAQPVLLAFFGEVIVVVGWYRLFPGASVASVGAHTGALAIPIAGFLGGCALAWFGRARVARPGGSASLALGAVVVAALVAGPAVSAGVSRMQEPWMVTTYGSSVATGFDTLWSVPNGRPQIDWAIACPNAVRCLAVGGGNENLPSGAVASTAAGGWQVRPIGGEGTGGVGSQLDCPSPVRCYLFGGADDPFIFVSNNGGLSWVKSIEEGSVFVLLSCPTAMTCYAVNPGSGMVVTRDGGSTWQSLLPLADGHAEVTFLTCPSASICDLGEYSTSPPYRSSTLVTDDGGRTWRHEPAERTSLAVRVSVGGRWVHVTLSTLGLADRYSCPGDHTCYATAHVANRAVIVRSGDGGRSWRVVQTTHDMVNSYPSVEVIACGSPAHCVAALSTRPISPVPDSVTLLETVDGGRTWTETAFPALPRSDLPKSMPTPY